MEQPCNSRGKQGIDPPYVCEREKYTVLLHWQKGTYSIESALITLLFYTEGFPYI